MQEYEELEVELSSSKLMNLEDTPHVVVTSSGTSAIQVALESFDFARGKEVLVPEFTMIACARAVVMAGLKPVFVDCNYDLLMDPKLAESKITDNTVAILSVNIYGRLCSPEIDALAKKHNLIHIEDCAESHTAKRLKPVTPDARCFSFYQNKIVAGEEGGAIAYKDENRACSAKMIRCQGFTAEHNFVHRPGGFNARLSNANAQIIRRSLYHLEETVSQRRTAEEDYWSVMKRNGLDSLDMNHRAGPRSAPWVYDLWLPEDVPNEKVVRLLNKEHGAGVARVGFKPMSYQPEFFTNSAYEVYSLKAYHASYRVIYLSLDPHLGSHKREKIVQSLCESVERYTQSSDLSSC